MRFRIVLLFLILGLFVSNAWAVGFLGPSTAELNKGQWSLGYNYSYSTQDMEKANVAWSDTGDSSSGTDMIKIEDFKVQRHYASLGYGVEDWWEIYAQLGVSDVKETEKYYDPNGTFDAEFSTNFDTDLAWGWGTKLTFAKQDNVAWGIAVQMNWLDTSWDNKYSGGKEELDLESYDVVVSVGPTIDFGTWKLYGGPFYYCFNGDYDYKDEYESDGVQVYKESATVRADENCGGYIGVQIPLSESWDFTTEASMTGDGWGVGGGIAVKF